MAESASANPNGQTVPKHRRRKKDSGPFSKEVLDELLAGRDPTDLIGPDGLLKQLTKALVERAMSAELDHHLGYERGEEPPGPQRNRRNGTSSKTLRSSGSLENKGSIGSGPFL